MAENDHGAQNKEHGPSLGLIAIMGKALNDQKILNALLPAKTNKEALYEAAKKNACIELNDCDLDALLKIRTGGLNIIDLLKLAKECLSQHDPAPDPKICC
jgi:hypothetical protein